MNTPAYQNSGARILVVDDHDRARQSIADILRHAGHHVDMCSSGAEGLGWLDQQACDVVITDLKMPGMDGIEFIRQIGLRELDVQVVMVTAHATIASAVEAMRHGAFDYIEKPFTADQIESLVARALRHGAAEGPRSSVPAALGDRGPVMIGASPAMRKLRQRIAQVAPTDETVLVIGESGTGKELVALALHAASRRASAAFVGLNCPALAPQLMESELFGHERGAFTSADAPRVGRFELAEGGTILLDEVSEIELPLQAKLLRVLQERCYERVGSSETRRANVRVVATTNRDLHAAARAGRFREDLYYRLAVVPLEVPPLRERPEDIPALASHFLAEAAARIERPACQWDEAALSLLCRYAWPGNVRELQNLVTRAAVLADGDRIGAAQIEQWLSHSIALSSQITSPTVGAAFPSEGDPRPVKVGHANLQDMERRMIEETLDRFGGHRAKTSKALGIGIRTLANKLRAYGYPPRAKEFAKAS